MSVASVVLTNAVPSDTASCSPWRCFLLLLVVFVLRASWSLGLFDASGSSNWAECSLNVRGTSPLSFFCFFELFVFSCLDFCVAV